MKIALLVSVLLLTSFQTASQQAPVVADFPGISYSFTTATEITKMWRNQVYHGACVYGRKEVAKTRYPGKVYWLTKKVIGVTALPVEVCKMPAHIGVIRFYHGSTPNADSLVNWAMAALSDRPDLGFVVVITGFEATVGFDERNRPRRVEAPIGVVAVRLSTWGKCTFKKICVEKKGKSVQN